MVPSFSEIFTDFNSDGWRESFREFLGFFVKQFIPLVNTQIEKLYFARLDYPLLVFPLYLAAIISLIAFWKKPKPLTGALAGFFAGLLFYFYFHFWMYWIVVIGLLFIYILIAERKNRPLLKSFLILLGTLFIVTLPYLINFLQFSGLPETQEFIYRLGIATGRIPGLATLGYAYLFYIAIGAAVYFIYFRKGDRLTAALFWAMLAAMFVIWNVQILIGYVPAPNNWRRTVSPILFIIILHIIYTLTASLALRKPRLKPIIAAILIILTAGVVIKKINNALVIAANPDPRIIKGQTLPNELVASWDWINKNLEKEPKILTNSFMSSIYLTAYTGTRSFLPLWMLSPMPTQKLEERFLTAHAALGTTPENLKKALLNQLVGNCENNCPANTEENLKKNTWHLYGHFFRSRGDINSYLNKPLAITEDYVDDLIKKYHKLKVNLSDLRANYLYYGPWERQFNDQNLAKNSALKLIFHNNLVEIYKIRR